MTTEEKSEQVEKPNPKNKFNRGRWQFIFPPTKGEMASFLVGVLFAVVAIIILPSPVSIIFFIASLAVFVTTIRNGYKRGDVDYIYKTGKKHEVAGEVGKAEKCYQVVADLGFVKGRTNLGTLALKKGDKQKAYGLFLSAAEQGEKRAMKNLAIMLDRGDGVPINQAHALEWYQKAGDDESLKRAGRLKERLMIPAASPPIDKVHPYIHVIPLVLYGEIKERGDVDYIYETGKKYEVAGEVGEAEKYYQVAADLGFVKGRTNLGTLALKKGDKQKAYDLFLSAAEQGEKRAMKNLAIMLDRGDGVPINQARALEWYQKAGDAESLKRAEYLKEKLTVPAALLKLHAHIHAIPLVLYGKIKESKVSGQEIAQLIKENTLSNAKVKLSDFLKYVVFSAVKIQNIQMKKPDEPTAVRLLAVFKENFSTLEESTGYTKEELRAELNTFKKELVGAKKIGSELEKLVDELIELTQGKTEEVSSALTSSSSFLPPPTTHPQSSTESAGTQGKKTEQIDLPQTDDKPPL